MRPLLLLHASIHRASQSQIVCITFVYYRRVGIELKRTLLAAGLLTRQDLLLLDEPFDGLDLRQARDVMALLKAHASTGRTLFLSIHQLTDAERICHRFVLLADGRVRGAGSLDTLRTQTGLADGDLEAVFLALT